MSWIMLQVQCVRGGSVADRNLMSEQRESGIAVAEKLVRNVRHYCVILGAVRKSEEWWEGSKEVTSESTWRNLSWLKGMMNVSVVNCIRINSGQKE